MRTGAERLSKKKPKDPHQWCRIAVWPSITPKVHSHEISESVRNRRHTPIWQEASSGALAAEARLGERFYEG